MDDLRHLRRPGNPRTRQATRRQLWLEVYLPLALALVAVGGLVGLASWLGYGTAGSWADMVLVLLALPLAVILALMAAALAGAVVVLARLMREVPGFAGGLQDGVGRAAQGVRRGSQLAARPFVVPRAAIEAVGQALRSLRRVVRTPWGWPDE